MFKIDHFARVATASVGALLLSTMAIVAAAGPADAVATARTAFASASTGAQAHG